MMSFILSVLLLIVGLAVALRVWFAAWLTFGIGVATFAFYAIIVLTVLGVWQISS